MIRQLPDYIEGSETEDLPKSYRTDGAPFCRSFLFQALPHLATLFRLAEAFLFSLPVKGTGSDVILSDPATAGLYRRIGD
ncbi:MAG TPA: hypothetical protein PLD62_02720 [Candidatus Cloacimonadota bacterium]|nr:hypothetical protein [Candidatus Cloacimonadota bacterium]